MRIDDLKAKQDIFNQVANDLISNKDEIIDILCEIETYKTAKNEVEKAIKTLQTFYKENDYLINRAPRGEVGIFLPYNMPLYSLVLYSFGPMYSGNKVYVRPSKMTSNQLKRILEMLSTTKKLPLELIFTDGKSFVERICTNDAISTVIFTGGWDSVTDIKSKLPKSKTLIYCGSGVCPLIVRSNANIDLAVKVSMESRFFNSGQDCLSTEKILVHKSCYDQYIKKLLTEVSKVKVGENKNKNTIIGPLISEAMAKRAQELFDNSDGEKIYVTSRNGCEVGPSIIVAKADDAVVKSEKFASIFALVKCENDEEMISIANDSEYILGVTVIGEQYSENTFLAKHVEYNRSVLDLEEDDTHAPFGGYKRSGFVLNNNLIKEGPILFSVETSNEINEIKKEKNIMENKKMYINGEWVESKSGKTFNSYNPANLELIAIIPDAQQEDVDCAVRSARVAYDEVWSKTTPAERTAYLNKIAELIEANAEELAYLDMIDAGKPILDCQFDIPACVDIFRFQASMTDKIQGRTYPVQNGSFAYSRREPYGVVGAIVPWNYPIYNATLKVAPILAMGNCCILKPAEQTSLSALKLAQLVEEAGVPKGVFNVVTGLGESAGAALTEHDDVDMISFTGSTEVGRTIMKASANSNLKKLSLELGGKSPFIIFEDADIEQAVDSACMTIFYNQGQTCTAGSRLFLQKSIAEKATKMILEKVSKIVVGNPTREDVHLGSIVSKEQMERVLYYIELGKQEGAKLLYGGKRITTDGCDKGCFIEPTVFTNVTNDMRIAQEEIFGPVMLIMTFDDEDDAVKIANETKYGLATSIWTTNSAKLIRMINAINAGIVWSNCVARENVGVPVGGFKQSGFGKESGMEACEEYTREKTVWIDIAKDGFKWIE